MTKTTQYKNTAIGPIPTDWEVKKFGDIITYKKGFAFKNEFYSESGRRIIRVSDTNAEGIKREGKIFISEDLAKTYKDYELNKNDIVIQTVGSRPPMFDSMVGKAIKVDLEFEGALLNQNAVLLRSENNEFLYNNLKIQRYVDYISSLIRGNANQVSITLSDIFKYEIPLPPLAEQQKIAEILSTWDKAIQDTDAIIKKMEARNKALANKLISFKDSSSHKKIKEVVDRIKKAFIPIKEELYTQIGIRSHAKGLFYKEPVTGKELGNKSVFWIEPNCFVVNIVFAWEQAVAKTTDKELGYIASHRFPMYKPKQGVLDLDYLLYLFKTPKGKDLLEFASPGGAGRNKTLGQSNFLELNIPVPPIEEQRNAIEVLNTANHELKQYQEKLEVLKLQKKGLMQQLLTGKIRTV